MCNPPVLHFSPTCILMASVLKKRDGNSKNHWVTAWRTKCPEQLPNYIIFWRSKNWDFVVFMPWDFRVTLMPWINKAIMTNTLGSHLTSLVPKSEFSTAKGIHSVAPARSPAPLKPIPGVYSAWFSLYVGTDVQNSSGLCLAHKSTPVERLKLRVPQTSCVLFANFLRTT